MSGKASLTAQAEPLAVLFASLYVLERAEPRKSDGLKVAVRAANTAEKRLQVGRALTSGDFSAAKGELSPPN